ncbi:chitooligosaccharide deacetylase NodB [Frankia sp. Cppng1_Ct_nod]|uniref:chitooligosaccharide deacetylase NodB n=1 Tax=Frankia sp. Cppng1_Ct_nod TaxID=2897162 RepID=UPI0032EA159E
MITHGTRPGRRAGPVPRTRRIADPLAENNVVATFCVIGTYVTENPSLIRRMISDGHDVANHTMTHPDLSQCDPCQIQWEFAETSRRIATAAPGAHVGRLRPPYGIWTEAAQRISREYGLQPLGWTVDPRDWSRPGIESIMRTVRDQLWPGGIILLHDGCPPAEMPETGVIGIRDQTVTALRFLIPELRSQGFAFDLPFPPTTPGSTPDPT